MAQSNKRNRPTGKASPARGEPKALPPALTQATIDFIEWRQGAALPQPPGAPIVRGLVVHLVDAAAVGPLGFDLIGLWSILGKCPSVVIDTDNGNGDGRRVAEALADIDGYVVLAATAPHHTEDWVRIVGWFAPNAEVSILTTDIARYVTGGGVVCPDWCRS